jgi:hypothetical protein
MSTVSHRRALLERLGETIELLEAIARDRTLLEDLLPQERERLHRAHADA